MAVLGREEISERVGRGQILCEDRFEPASLRGAGYDLRIAQDEMHLSEGLELTSPRDSDVATLVLKPGDVAWVSTYERFCMPWDVAANIGARFHFASHGLWVFSGLLVDPGYGLEWDEQSEAWTARADERLRFPITNIGSAPIDLALGEHGSRILSLQFFQVPEVPDADRDRVAKRLDPGEGRQEQALAFFRDLRTLERDTGGRLTTLRSEGHEAVAAVERRLDALRTDLDVARSSIDRVVVFGIFLLSVTLLGVCVTLILENADQRGWVGDFNRLHPAVGAIVVTTVVCATLAFLAWTLVRAVSQRKLRPPSPPAPAPPRSSPAADPSPAGRAAS